MPPFRPTPRLCWSMPELFSNIRPRRQPQVVHVQRVRFRSPIRLRNIALSIGVTIFAVNIYDAVVIGPLARATEKAAQGLSRGDLADVDDSPIFIPFPFTEREVKLPPYSGKDPEWLKFCEISRDKDLMTNIRQDLANICVDAAKRSPSLLNKMGSDISIDHYWLVIQYPMGPPPESQRQGIELGDDGIAWVERKVEFSTIQRLQRILWPTPLAMSMWHFSWALFKQNIQDAARRFGISSAPSDPAAERVIAQAAENMMAKAHASKHSRPPTVSEPGEGGEEDGGISAANKRQTESGPVTDNPNKPPAPTPPPISARDKTTTATGTGISGGKNEAGSGTSENDEEDKLRPQDMYPYQAVKERMKGAWEEFFKSWNVRWKRVRDYPPRGVVIVSGMVQVKSRHGWALIDCTGCWDPKTRDYVGDNVWLKMRMFRPIKQRPLR